MIRPAISPVYTSISNWLHSIPLDELDDCSLGTSVSPNPNQSNSRNIPLQARTKEFLYKPAEEQNPRLNRGSSPIRHRFITGTRSALSSRLPTSGTTPFCLVKPFHAGHIRKPTEEQNPRLTIGASAVYQRFISWGRSTLSSWQERRALFVPVINRG